MSKELFTRRYYKPLIEAIRNVKEETGKSHTQFIEEAIDEKLVREGYTDESLLLNEVDDG